MLTRRRCCRSGCSQTFGITGCTRNIPGATVSVYDHAGGTLLASGTTNSGGLVTLSWSAGGSVYVTVSGGDGFDTYGASRTLTCGGATGITLTVKSGWACCGIVPMPQSNLHVTMVYSGCATAPFSGTATFASGQWGWVGGVYLLQCQSGTPPVLNLTFPYGCNINSQSYAYSPLTVTINVNTVNCPGFSTSGCSSMVVTLTQ